MLRSAESLRDCRIESPEGEVGSVDDLYFDDQRWELRYLVVDLGGLLPGPYVLLAPEVLERPDGLNQVIRVRASRAQIAAAPAVDRARPVSRQLERILAQHFGWTAFWEAPGPGRSATAVEPPPLPGPPLETLETAAADPHLRSFREVHNYRIHATDGEIGHLADFVIDDEDWSIRYVVVDTRNWLPGRKVLVAPNWCRGIDWAARQLHVELTRNEIRNSPPFDSSAPINRDYEGRLYDYYGRPGYWI